MKKELAVVSLAFVLLLTQGSAVIVARILFDINCSGRLKRASDAGTIPLAKQELRAALTYLEGHNMTKGSTAVIYRTPDTDVGYWYDNLSGSLYELENLAEDSTALERTNVLLKLRGTLLDEKQSRVIVTLPPGISIFPYNKIFFLWGRGGVALLCVGVFLLIRKPT